jgi:hypothetical protein
VLRSGRPDETEEVDEFVWSGAAGSGCVVRAREDLRGDMMAMWFVRVTVASP